jgi:hypothetical protein
MGGQIVLSTTLGLVFAASAVPKLRHPRGFALAVLEYRVLPAGLGRLYARLVPPLEFLLAVLLITGTAVRSAAVATGALLLSFILAVAINVARGRDLDCHCFGKAVRRAIGPRLLVQDAALLGASLIVAASARAWVASEPWSPVRLFGLVRPESPGPLVGCGAITVCVAALLQRSGSRKWRYAPW